MRCVLLALALLAAHGEVAAQTERLATPAQSVLLPPPDDDGTARPRDVIVAELADCDRRLRRAGSEVAGGLMLLVVGVASIPAGIFGSVWGIFAAGTCDVGCAIGIGIGGAAAIAAIISGALIARGGNQTKLVLLPRRDQLQLELRLHANGLALSF